MVFMQMISKSKIRDVEILLICALDRYQIIVIVKNETLI